MMILIILIRIIWDTAIDHCLRRGLRTGGLCAGILINNFARGRYYDEKKSIFSGNN
jgi:hypothetical protein